MKNYFFLLILAAFMGLPQPGKAQATLKFGPEIGVALSQFSKDRSYIIYSRNDKVNETTAPVYSPLIGFTTELTVNKYFQFTAGLQYQKTGQRDYYHRDGNDLLYDATYQHTRWENQTFSKLGLPVSIGLTTRVWKLQPAIFVGVRPNFFLTGENYYRSDFNHDDPARDEVIEHEFNPLNAGFPVKRLTSQILFGVSSYVGPNIRFSLSYQSGKTFLYQEGDYPGCLPYSFSNNDYIFSVAYLFSAAKK